MGVPQPSYIYASTLTRRDRAWRRRRRAATGHLATTVGGALVGVGGVAALLAHFLGV